MGSPTTIPVAAAASKTAADGDEPKLSTSSVDAGLSDTPVQTCKDSQAAAVHVLMPPRWLLLLARRLADRLGIPVVVGGDFNLDARKLNDAPAGAKLVEYAVNPRRNHNVVDWLYLVNATNGSMCLVCDQCEAIDPAQPYRDELADEENVKLHSRWFDHDALLAVLRLVSA